MQVSDIMSRHPITVNPDQTLREAAELMSRADCGFLPVGENDRLVGMLTDRDIALRGVARGKGPDATVREAMSDGVCFCRTDDDVESVAVNMGELQLRRMPVIDEEKRLVGILSLGDIAVRQSGHEAGAALERISAPDDA